MLSQLGRNLFNAQHRILDHRAFVDGEVDNFLHEFEIKRNDSEVETLFAVTETVGELKYDLCERCASLGTTHLGELSNEISKLLSGVEDYLAKTQAPKGPSEFLTQSRLQRDKKRAEFLEDFEHKIERARNSFEEKEEEISELYSDLQLKLNIPK